MKFGTFHLYSVPPSTTAAEVVRHRAVRTGSRRRRAGIPMRFVGGAPTGASTASMACPWWLQLAIAAATKRVRIATAVTAVAVTPSAPCGRGSRLRLTSLSGGRVDWGVGKATTNTSSPPTASTLRERKGRWQESFDAIRQMWATAGAPSSKGSISTSKTAIWSRGRYNTRSLPTYHHGVRQRVVCCLGPRAPPADAPSARGRAWDDIRAKLEL